WSTFEAIPAPGAFSAFAQYVQYRADLATSDPVVTPQLEDIIISTDQAPVAVNDSASTALNTPYTFAAAGSTSLKANDSDADTPFIQLRVDSVTSAAHGSATLNANGSVTYTPASGFSGADTFTYTPSANTFGPDSFTYRVQDALGNISNIATVFISVTAVNDPPSFTRGPNQIVAEDSGSQTVTGWATGISAGPGESGQALNF